MAITFDSKTNFAYSVVAVAPSPADSGTTLTVATGDGAKFPAVPFNATIWPTGVQPTTGNAEIVRVTNVSGDVLTFTREQEGTPARTVLVNDQISCNLTVKTMTDIESAFATASVLATPIGGAIMWFTDTAPTGYLMLRGQAVSRTTYATLFALWGTTYGAGDGSTTFNVPNLQARIPIGRDTTATYAAIDTLGETQGTWDHTHGTGTYVVANHTHGPGTLTVASHTHGAGSLQVASHSHGTGTLAVASHSHSSSFTVSSVDLEHSHSLSNHTHGYSGSTSSDGAHTHNVNNVNAALEAGTNNGSVATNTSEDGAHTHSFSGTTSGPSDNSTGLMSIISTHSHTLSGSTSAEAPGLTGVTGTQAPLVNAGTTGAEAPAVTGGATGNQVASTGLASGVSGAANPPVIVVNFIVRATNEV